MEEQPSISGRDKPAGIGDQPEHVPPFARTLPYRPGKRAMVRKNEAEGEVARRGASLQRVVDAEQPGVARALIGGGKRGPVGPDAVAARQPLQAESGGDPQSAGGIAWDRVGRDGPGWRMAHAQAKPCGPVRGDDMPFLAGGDVNERLGAGRKRERLSWILGLDDYDVRRGGGRPERWRFARVCLRVCGESSSPIAGTGPPVLPPRSEVARRCGSACLHDPDDSRRCDSGIPARNPHSHGLDTDLRSMVTAKTNHRT